MRMGKVEVDLSLFFSVLVIIVEVGVWLLCDVIIILKLIMKVNKEENE